MERKKLLAAVTRALKIAKVRETRIAMLCDNNWRRKLKLLPSNVLRNKFKYIIGNCTLRTLKAMYSIFSVDQEVQRFADSCILKRSGLSDQNLAGPAGKITRRLIKFASQ